MLLAPKCHTAAHTGRLMSESDLRADFSLLRLYVALLCNCILTMTTYIDECTMITCW